VTSVELGEVASIRSSLVDPTDDLFGHLPHIAPDNVERDTGRLLGFTSVREAGVKSGKYRFESGDVLYSKIRPNLNKVALVGFEGLCSADMYPLSVDPTKLVNAYLAHLLRSPRFLSYAVRLSNRANIPKLNREQLLRPSTGQRSTPIARAPRATPPVTPARPASTVGGRSSTLATTCMTFWRCRFHTRMISQR
jgi:hypothetical protein